jgi:putative SbcD/Mre11-related phosphoesterase
MLTHDVELLNGLPIAYIHSLDLLAFSDIHLGYEGVMAKKGVLIPKVNLKHTINVVKQALEETGAKRILINGDIKNDFSNVDIEEFNELYDFMEAMKESDASIVLVKGNHDNFVDRYKDPFKLSIYAQEANIGGYFFLHGEYLPKLIPKGTKMVIMGHEHPAISIYNDVGRKEKLRCFLYGKYGRTKLLVLPAVGYFSSGTDINLTTKHNLLSPVLKKINIEGMHAIVCEHGETMDFGTIGALRLAAQQR